ncbi:MocR-like pyridoxine biosynthesis transcription factor PdxR [Nonomuraea africana]|uniref:MocR-like pyridoxine biosynthesis transcription factor PdxR n=1 Tax=Nonomuraea africana TaxID=46171 RepID=UPI0034000869
MDFHISLAGRADLAAQIYRQLRDAILDGRLRKGERLPPTRELARSLDVARNTVAVAYERLTADGFLEGRAGAGTFVSAPVRPALRRRAPQGGVRPRRIWTEIPPITSGGAPAFDFRVGLPDLALFPLETWRRLVTRELRVRAAGYLPPEGHEGLRVAIARYFGLSRSIRAAPDDVIVTQGAQQALDLVGRVLIEPGDCVAVEEPGYPPARRLFRSLGARVAGVPVDAEGLDVTAIPRTARLVYVTPSHQFPLGTPMSLARRTALLAWARQRDAVVIEDDYDSEFRFEDRPLEPLQSLDRSGRVVYVGSFSKTLAPMLRLGFLIAPASLQPALRVAKQLTDWHSETTAQAALARFIDEGLLARHVRKATRQYAARHALIAGFLREHLDLVPSAAGLHLCAKGEVDPARAPEVAVESLASYYAGPPEQGVVLGYGAIPLERIDEGLRRLIPALRVRRLSL